MSSETSQIEDKDEAGHADLETEHSVSGAEASADEDSAGGDESDVTLEEQLAQSQKTVKDYWDQMMRLRADIENNRKRAERDVENAHKYAMKNFTESLLPIIDSMEMGMSAAEAANATLQSIREGSELTMNMFVQVLEKQGLIPVDPIGEKFDPEQHQAISMIEDDEAESNTVISVMQKGFLLNDRLVRPAMVVVAK
ncbi:MAG: nucleotide exchange factor GrpE [Gammaproteobacteria bacterium]|nr:nucleotide exchange factor GrpE [Gammaproteobacteria bacterium]